MSKLEINQAKFDFIVKIKDAGITAIKLEFSGGGDSGSIESIQYSDQNLLDIEDVVDNFQENYDLVFNDSLVEELFDSILCSKEDWWNNEGGNGELYFHINSLEYHLSIDVAHIEYVNHSYLEKFFEGL